jgi:hypothetical protein
MILWSLGSGLWLGTLTPAGVHRHDHLYAMMREGPISMQSGRDMGMP